MVLDYILIAIGLILMVATTLAVLWITFFGMIGLIKDVVDLIKGKDVPHNGWGGSM